MAFFTNDEAGFAQAYLFLSPRLAITSNLFVVREDFKII